MPTRTTWVDPEVCLQHNDVTIYHTYRDDDMDQGRCRSYYTADGASDDNAFDIRDLDVPSKALLAGHPPFLSDSDPIYQGATPRQRKAFAADWTKWQEDGGGEDQAIRAVLKDAIEAGLIISPI
ncbi:MAG: hypothetical protein OEL20_04965 [Sulfuritalea sp.]|nr:hypothetical protein [Sulfuritalea sp.]